MKVLLFAVLSASLAAYAFWIYLRVELPIPRTRPLAVVRASVLVVLLLLLFDPRLPAVGPGGSPARWVLLDASASMSAAGPGQRIARDEAESRAGELEAEGWNVVRFGASPSADSRLVPALQQAAEGGARVVRVLSDMRLDDAVAARAALAELPLQVEFEAFGGEVDNAGVSRFSVADVPRPDVGPVAEVEVHGGVPGAPLTVEILEEDVVVATLPVTAPSPGLRQSVGVELPPSERTGRVRFTARVHFDGDGFGDDDEAVAYASVGYESGALVLVSFRADWEPRSLLPVLEEVTGLPPVGYLRAGPDRFIPMGRAVERGAPVDSATVRRAAEEAVILVLHGIGEEGDAWAGAVAARPGRRLLLPADAAGSTGFGISLSAPRAGEWYVSPEVPTSPIAGALVGVDLQGLPPLSNVMEPAEAPAQPPLQVQLRGAGAPQSAVLLSDRPEGRVAVVLASGFWRWAMRPEGREPYRRLWSGIAGWLLADERVASAEVRPERWVFGPGQPSVWTIPADVTSARIVVTRGDEADGGPVIDTTVVGGESAGEPGSGGPGAGGAEAGGTGGGATVGGVPRVGTGTLDPGLYRYTVLDATGDTTAQGRFDVTTSTREMIPVRADLEQPVAAAGAQRAGEPVGRPLRTLPWPYLLVIVLLCGEWVVRRRSGLR